MKKKNESNEYNEDEVDLFEYYEELPQEMKDVLSKYFEESELDYIQCEAFLKEVQALGYTFEYGLDAEPYGLRKMK